MNIPANLIDQIAKGNCVLFLGSGPSIAAGLPSWPQLLSEMIVWGEKQGIHFADKPEIELLINKEKFLLAAEELVERLGDAGFHRFMTDVFDDPELKPTEVHLLVAQIPFAAQVTTNYDPLSEKGYEATHNKVPLTFAQTDVAALSAALRSGDFYILKSHGTIERVETIVLSRKQYRAVMHDNPAYRRFLETLFSTKTVLFIGFGLNDPDLLLTLDELQAAFHGYTGRHYALMDEGRVSEIERGRFLKDYHIEIIRYKPSTRDHPEVTNFLKELLSAVPRLALRHKLGQARLLFDSAKSNSGGFDPDKFARLLQAARIQVSDDGEPLNALNSTTSDELATVLLPLVAELDANSKAVLTAKLIGDSWFSINAAANLFSVDIDIIRDKVRNPARPDADPLTTIRSDEGNEDEMAPKKASCDSGRS